MSMKSKVMLYSKISYCLWGVYSIGFILSSIIVNMITIKTIFKHGFIIWSEPNLIILTFELISLFICWSWFLIIISIWSESIIRDFKKEREEKLRLWCTKCDIDMVKKGIALDCPEDGIFYECPSCKYRIVIFEKEVEKK